MMADDLPFTNSLTTALAEVERLRAENERLRSIYGCKCEEVVRRAEQTEARLAQMVGALMEAGHGTQRGGHSRGVTGDCGLCDALAAAKPEEKSRG